MKKTLFIFISLFTSLLFAQTKINSDYASAYRQALISFEDKQYGTSLKYAQDAIRLKKENVLKNSCFKNLIFFEIFDILFIESQK